VWTKDTTDNRIWSITIDPKVSHPVFIAEGLEIADADALNRLELVREQCCSKLSTGMCCGTSLLF
jgi:hypothetical protein